MLSLADSFKERVPDPTIMFGFCDFKYSPMPVIVPPVPTELTRMSTWPAVSLQISGPV